MLLMPAAYGAGAIEHDITCLYKQLPEGQSQPGPLPLGVNVVDASIVVFGLVFPRAAHKHKLQMLDHFYQHLSRQQLAAISGGSFGVNTWGSASQSPTKGEALNINIFSAVLAVYFSQYLE